MSLCLNISTPLTFCAFSKLNLQNQACYKIVPHLRNPVPPGRKRSFPKRRAEETTLQVAHEDALAIEDSNHEDTDDKDLPGLPVDDVEDRLSRLHLKSASNNQTVADDKCPVGKESLTVPGVEEGSDNGEITPKFSGNPLEYSKFKAAFKVEVDKKEVCGAIDKLKSLLDAEEESAKSCLIKFMPGSDKYKKTWHWPRGHCCVRG